MNKILLTMGMPVYNEQEHIGEAIESLLAQTYRDFILIIVDNASEDRTPDICRYYADKDERIVFVRNKKNRGSMFSFCYLLEQIKTPFFMLCSGHDRWHPRFVEKLLPALKEENVILSYPRTKVIEMDGTMGKFCLDDYTTVAMDNPAKRYLYLLRRIKMCNLIHGIWLTRALKNCILTAKTVFLDDIILATATLEGKFKQDNEVLFYRREIRKKESYKNIILRQFAALHGEKYRGKMGVFSLIALFIWENVKVVFRKRYSLNTITRLWLVINILYFKSLTWVVKPALNVILKKILPKKIYSKLKSFRDERVLKSQYSLFENEFQQHKQC